MLIFASAQAMAADCQVLLPEGATHYVGECSGEYAHGHGKAFIPSRSDPTGYYEGEFKNGKLQGQATYTFARSGITSTEWYLAGKHVSKDEYVMGTVAAPAWELARKANTIAAYTEFIKDWPDLPLAHEALWQLAFEPVRRANTSDAYKQFIKQYPDSPQAADALLHVQNASRRLNAPKELRLLSTMEFCELFGKAVREENLLKTLDFGDKQELHSLIKKEANRRKITFNVKLVSNKQFRLGMTQCDMYASWGSPDEENRSVGAWGVHIQHVYDGAYVYTENGRITSWQD